jgi:PleD family two-component response regulator
LSFCVDSLPYTLNRDLVKPADFGKVQQILATVPEEAWKPEQHNSTLRILIVDDKRGSADSIAIMLKIVGNETFIAYDGEEAVPAAGSFRPDVFCSTSVWQMGFMGGGWLGHRYC